MSEAYPDGDMFVRYEQIVGGYKVKVSKCLVASLFEFPDGVICSVHDDGRSVTNFLDGETVIFDPIDGYDTDDRDENFLNEAKHIFDMLREPTHPDNQA